MLEFVQSYPYHPRSVLISRSVQLFCFRTKKEGNESVPIQVLKLLKKHREESKQVVGDVDKTVNKNKSTVLVEKSEEESNDLETEKLLISL